VDGDVSVVAVGVRVNAVRVPVVRRGRHRAAVYHGCVAVGSGGEEVDAGGETVVARRVDGAGVVGIDRAGVRVGVQEHAVGVVVGACVVREQGGRDRAAAVAIGSDVDVTGVGDRDRAAAVRVDAVGIGADTVDVDVDRAGVGDARVVVAIRRDARGVGGSRHVD